MPDPRMIFTLVAFGGCLGAVAFAVVINQFLKRLELPR